MVPDSELLLLSVRTLLFSLADFVSPEPIREPLLTPETEFSRRELLLTDSLPPSVVALLSRADADEPLMSFLATLVLPDLR